ncbi:hypothetical protein EHQ12_10265 [Leptospira gomenensis]|uniref:Uncharacterized protein n=1 Tax=Leptospira gomenensis TaxID=2484974 RepID=A0A5F1YEI1_9LEPT|nr:hypothetical protein EHQ17_03830 [Leptospira gomenensis]TGK38237.1 hypothetical protein EHQ12_10265 [Leptospira gomenensis]TGK45978.1 hypothetical protein EHQ07_07390 [Leptospira gomenensis]TGK65242.1 hypothetical protein EHQ13_05195 [Leptospira gomenensis]
MAAAGRPLGTNVHLASSYISCVSGPQGAKRPRRGRAGIREPGVTRLGAAGIFQKMNVFWPTTGGSETRHNPPT